MHIRVSLLLSGAALCTLAMGADAADVVFAVGPSGQYQRISDAVAAADADTDPNNYYVIQVAPGTYVNDFSKVTRPMTIEVDPNRAGQDVVIDATIPPPNQKGLVLATASLRVNGLTFTRANISNSLGGNSKFIDNQEGILTGDNFGETITIINTRFM